MPDIKRVDQDIRCSNYTRADFKEKAQKRIETLLKDRTRFNVIESEADVVAGASVIMGLVNEFFFKSSKDDSMDIIPPLWFIAPMSGRSIVEELKKDE